MGKDKKLGKLLIVDDDKIIVKLLSRIFEKYCDLMTAYSGEEALKILKEGYRPGVILSDQMMPGINGSEFLARSISYVPDAKRIILTGNTDVSDIMDTISEAKAFQYLLKPFDNIALIKTVSNAFEEYNIKKDLKKKVSDYSAEIERLEKRIANLVGDSDPEEEFRAVINQFYKLAVANSKFYFRQSINNICITTRYLAQEMDLTNTESKNLLYAGFIFNINKIGLSEEMQLLEPHEMTKAQRERYSEQFIQSYSELLNSFTLKRIADICIKMWEKPDGKGFPSHLKKDNIPFESILLNIAVRYENSVYRLRYEDLEKLRKNGTIVQTPEETRKRHDEALKLLKKDLTFYEQQPFSALKNLITLKKCPSLIPEEKELKISYIR